MLSRQSTRIRVWGRTLLVLVATLVLTVMSTFGAGAVPVSELSDAVESIETTTEQRTESTDDVEVVESPDPEVSLIDETIETTETTEPVEIGGDAGAETAQSQLLEPDTLLGLNTLTALGDGPHLTWEVHNSDGDPVGGARVELQGSLLIAGTGGDYWPRARQIEDCVSGTCEGYADKDPEPGKFAVFEVSNATGTGNSPVQDQHVYRIRPIEEYAPTGYAWQTPSDNWIQIPRSGQTMYAEPGQWGGGVYSFPALKLTAAPSLTWEVREQNESGALVDGAMVTLKAASSTNPADTWDREVRVSDCVAGPCAAISMDQDPTPGVFRVHTLRWGTSRGFDTEKVSKAKRYEVAPYDSPVGYGWSDSNASLNVGSGADWPDDEPYDLGDLFLTQGSSLAWEVAQGNTNIGGATIELEGPFDEDSNSWTQTYYVTDCTIAPCHPTSMDRDPEPGKFEIDSVRWIDNNMAQVTDINAGQRYRIKASGSVPGYSWASSDFSSMPEGAQWEGGKYKFPDPLKIEYRGQYSNVCVAAENPRSYYSLSRINDGAAAQILKHTFTADEGSFEKASPPISNSEISSMLGTGQVADALGVTRDGIFYFAGQHISSGNEQARNVSVYRFDPAVDLQPYPVFDMDMLSPTTGVIVAGDATNYGRFEEYYFAYYSYEPQGGGGIRFHLYRYSHGNGDRTGEVRHVDVPAPMDFDRDSMTGDFAFDAQNNIQYLISDDEGRTVSGFIEATDFQQYSSAHTLADVEQSEGQGYFGTVGTGINGVAYSSSGRAIIQGAYGNSDRHRFVTLPSIDYQDTTFQDFAPAARVDLAGCFSPTTVTVQMEIIGDRFNSDDQFTLNASHDIAGEQVPGEVSSVTTSGEQSGIQSAQIGPFATTLVGAFHVSQTFTNENAADYLSSWACYKDPSDVQNGDPFLASNPRDPEEDPTSFIVELGDGTVTPGADIICIFTHIAKSDGLSISNVADISPGTAVNEGEIIEYQLTFDNTTGLGVAVIDHGVHLADVLDDAFFIDANNQRSTNPVIAQTSGGTSRLNVNWVATSNSQLRIQGEVPPGYSASVSFRVMIKDNDSERTNASLFGYLTQSFITLWGGNAPEYCFPEEAAAQSCIQHPVSAWTLQMAADPAGGEEVSDGDIIRYRLIAEKKTPNTAIDGLVFTDNLSEVLTVAGFVQDEESNGIYFFDGSGATLEVPVGANAESAPNGGTPDAPRKGAGIPEPIADDDQRWILTNDPINVPQNAVRAELWFSVRIADNSGPSPLAGTSFTNYVTAEANSLPPAQCVTDGQCRVTHTIRTFASIVLPLTGGRSLMLLTVTGGVLLALAGGGVIWWRRQQQSGSAD